METKMLLRENFPDRFVGPVNVTEAVRASLSRVDKSWIEAARIYRRRLEESSGRPFPEIATASNEEAAVKAISSAIVVGEITEDVLSMAPERTDWGVQYAFVGANGTRAVIRTSDGKEHEVRQMLRSVEEHCGSLLDEDDIVQEGETVRDAMKRLGIKSEGIVILVYDDSLYCQGDGPLVKILT